MSRRPSSRGLIEVFDHFVVLQTGYPSRGANPKDLLEDPASGRKYVAKLGRRNSDLEVITEYVIYLVGQNIGADVAPARIGRFQGQLRFLSEYFLDEHHQLAHGVELFRDLVEGVDAVLEDPAREQEFFTVQAVEATLGAHYMADAPAIFDGFLRMLIHDAIIGIQDRHHENWGVITTREKAKPIRFAPLYDSAAGLFKNMDDRALRSKFRGKAGEQALNLYVERSHPLIGWRGAPTRGRKYLTHIELVAAVYRGYSRCRGFFDETLARYDWRTLDSALRQLQPFVGPHRRALMLACIRRRIRKIRKTINEVVLTPEPRE